LNLQERAHGHEIDSVFGNGIVRTSSQKEQSFSLIRPDLL